MPEPVVTHTKTVQILHDSESEDLEEDMMRDLDCFSSASDEDVNVTPIVIKGA